MNDLDKALANLGTTTGPDKIEAVETDTGFHIAIDNYRPTGLKLPFGPPVACHRSYVDMNKEELVEFIGSLIRLL